MTFHRHTPEVASAAPTALDVNRRTVVINLALLTELVIVPRRLSTEILVALDKNLRGPSLCFASISFLFLV